MIGEHQPQKNSPFRRIYQADLQEQHLTLVTSILTRLMLIQGRLDRTETDLKHFDWKVT